MKTRTFLTALLMLAAALAWAALPTIVVEGVQDAGMGRA
jgi:hypothetical protein